MSQKESSQPGLGRLAVPLGLFGLFLGLSLLSDDLLGQFGAEAVSQSRRVFAILVQVGIWLTSAWTLNRLLAVFFWDGVVARALGGPVPRLLRDVVGAVIFLIAASGIMAFVFERSVTGLWATSGVVGIVLGFALQSLILDVFTGLAINMDRPYRIGDWIMVHGRVPELHIIGNVMEVNWRTTRLRTAAGNMVIIPNSQIGMTTVTNWMEPEPTSRLELCFTLDYAVPSERALRVFTAAIRAVATGGRMPLSDPAPKVRINEVSPLGVEYRIRYWIRPVELSPNRSRHIVITSVLDHLRQAGLTLAYPKRDVFFEPMPHRQLDGGSGEDRRDLLSRVDLFRALSEEERAELADRMVQRNYPAGKDLIRANASGESMFVLVEGLVYVFAESAGEQVKVGQVVPGQCFGEMSLLTGEPRSATVSAATSTVAYEITREHISPLLERRPELLEHVSRVVAERRARTQKALSASTTQEINVAEQTLAAQLVNRMRSFFQM